MAVGHDEMVGEVAAGGADEGRAEDRVGHAPVADAHGLQHAAGRHVADRAVGESLEDLAALVERADRGVHEVGRQVEVLRGAEDGQQMAVAAPGEGVAGDDDDIDIGEHAPQLGRRERRGDALVEGAGAEFLPVAPVVGVAHVRAGPLEHPAVRLRDGEAHDLRVITAVVEETDGQRHRRRAGAPGSGVGAGRRKFVTGGWENHIRHLSNECAAQVGMVTGGDPVQFVARRCRRADAGPPGVRRHADIPTPLTRGGRTRACSRSPSGRW